MSDVDLTPEQWRQARQAGAAFTPPAEEEALTPYGQQPVIGGMMPAPGSLWRNRHTFSIVTVLSVEQRRYAWVHFRRDGRQSTDTLTGFLEHHQPCRPDGTLL